AGAGRAVDGAEDGDVVAGAVAPVAAVVAQERARRARTVTKRCFRHLAAKRIVALEGVSADVVDVDVAAGRDVLAGEADDLPVLVDRLALPDVAQGELVAEVDPAAQAQGAAVVLHFETRLEVPGGDGDIVL